MMKRNRRVPLGPPRSRGIFAQTPPAFASGTGTYPPLTDNKKTPSTKDRRKEPLLWPVERERWAQRLTELEERAFQLAVDVTTARPMIYATRQGSENADELSAIWNEAADAVALASIAVAILLNRIEERAGLDAEGLQRQREERRGLVPSEAAEDNGTANPRAAAT